MGPLVLLIVLTRPLLVIRIGTMINSRIGHFMLDVEAYLCERDKDKESHRTFDIICCSDPVCNTQAKLMWARTILITPGAKFWKHLDLACQFWTQGDIHHVPLYNRKVDYKLISVTEAHLSFVDEEIFRGKHLLNQLGIPLDALWICIHNRDSGYLDKVFGSSRTYRGRAGYDAHRDFSIKSMVEMCNKLADLGYYVVRMGSFVTEKLATNNPRVIDYSSNPIRSDFLDIFLLANCYSYIGSDSGISCIPYVFRRPVFFINWNIANIDELIVREYAYPILIKRLWHCEQQRFLSIREIFEAGLDGSDEAYLFENARVNVISNTSDEICQHALELVSRLKGTWTSNFEDEELQRQFWDIYNRHAPNERSPLSKVRIGAAFLRNNLDLLN